MIRLFDKWSIDPPLVIAITALTLFGIAMIYSAGVVYVPNPVTSGAWIRQAQWFVLAVIAFTLLSRVPLRWIEWVSVPAYVISVVLLGITLVIGTGSGTAAGVKAWIDLGFIRFQPSEIAKLATVLMLAKLLSQRDSGLSSVRDLLPAAAIVALPLALVLRQPDLGTAMAFVGILFAMLYWAATPVPLLLLVASPVLGLFLSYDTAIWSGYILAVIGCLYLYRYKLFLFESVAVVLANFATATISRPLWKTGSSCTSTPKSTRGVPAIKSFSPRLPWVAAGSADKASRSGARSDSTSCPSSTPISFSALWARNSDSLGRRSRSFCSRTSWYDSSVWPNARLIPLPAWCSWVSSALGWSTSSSTSA
jgi:hypothetical protein